MSMDREDIEEAIEVLEDASAEMLMETGEENYYSEAIAVLRQALGTEQDPVAWLKTWSDGSVSVLKSKSGAFADHELEPLYAAPQKRDLTCVCGAVWDGEMMVYPPKKREWVGLTAYEIQEIHSGNQHWGNFACAIETKLWEKNA